MRRIVMQQDRLFPAQDVAKSYGLALSTIEFYIAKQLLLPVLTNDRLHFTARDLLCIEIIQVGKKLGFSLNEIKDLIDAHSTVDKRPPER